MQLHAVMLASIAFLARDSMLSALYVITNPSVRLSVCPSVRLSVTWAWVYWSSRKRLKLGSCSFRHTVASSLWFQQDIRIISRNSDGIPPPERRRQTIWGKQAIFLVLTLSLDGCTNQIFYRSCDACPTSNLLARWRHCRALTVASVGLSCFGFTSNQCKDGYQLSGFGTRQ